RTAEKRDVQEAWAIEVGHVARAPREKPSVLEAWDPGADHEDWRGRDAPSNTSPSRWALRTRAPSNTSPSGWARRRLPPSNSPTISQLRPRAAPSTCCRVFLSRSRRRGAALRETPLDRRR